jgi:S1-C subfamily serine protease
MAVMPPKEKAVMGKRKERLAIATTSQGIMRLVTPSQIQILEILMSELDTWTEQRNAAGQEPADGATVAQKKERAGKQEPQQIALPLPNDGAVKRGEKSKTKPQKEAADTASKPTDKAEQERQRRVQSNSDVLVNPNARIADKMHAAASLYNDLPKDEKGNAKINLKDGGNEHESAFSIERSKVGDTTGLAIKGYDDQGRPQTALRATEKNGHFLQPKNEEGKSLPFEGDWWSNNRQDSTLSQYKERTSQNLAPNNAGGEQPLAPSSPEDNLRGLFRAADTRAATAKPDAQRNALLNGGETTLEPTGFRSQEGEPGSPEIKPASDVRSGERPEEAFAGIRATGYSWKTGGINGGKHDMFGREVRTTHDFFSGKSNFVSAAMDKNAHVKDGQLFYSPELDGKYSKELSQKFGANWKENGDHLWLRATDTGGAFNHTWSGRNADKPTRIDIATETPGEANRITNDRKDPADRISLHLLHENNKERLTALATLPTKNGKPQGDHGYRNEFRNHIHPGDPRATVGPYDNTDFSNQDGSRIANKPEAGLRAPEPPVVSNRPAVPQGADGTRGMRVDRPASPDVANPLPEARSEQPVVKQPDFETPKTADRTPMRDPSWKTDYALDKRDPEIAKASGSDPKNPIPDVAQMLARDGNIDRQAIVGALAEQQKQALAAKDKGGELQPFRDILAAQAASVAQAKSPDDSSVGDAAAAQARTAFDQASAKQQNMQYDQALDVLAQTAAGKNAQPGDPMAGLAGTNPELAKTVDKVAQRLSQMTPGQMSAELKTIGDYVAKNGPDAPAHPATGADLQAQLLQSKDSTQAEKFDAIRALVKGGVNNVQIDGNNYRLAVESVGSKGDELVHMFKQGDNGKEQIALRSVYRAREGGDASTQSADHGHYEQQRSKHGKVDFTGTGFSRDHAESSLRQFGQGFDPSATQFSALPEGGRAPGVAPRPLPEITHRPDSRIASIDPKQVERPSQSNTDPQQTDPVPHGRPGEFVPAALPTDFNQQMLRETKGAAAQLRTIGDCGRGVRMALNQLGFHIDDHRYATQLGQHLKDSGLFNAVPLDQAGKLEPGMIVVRNWNQGVIRGHHGVNKGDIAVVDGRGGQFNDHAQQFHPDGGRYRNSYVLIAKGQDSSQVADRPKPAQPAGTVPRAVSQWVDTSARASERSRTIGSEVDPPVNRSEINDPPPKSGDAGAGEHTPVRRSANDWHQFFQGQNSPSNCSAAAMSMMYSDWDKGAHNRDLNHFNRVAGLDGGGYNASANVMARQLQGAIRGLHTDVIQEGSRQQIGNALDKQLDQGHTLIAGIKSPYHAQNNHYIYVAGKDSAGNYIIGDSGNSRGGKLGKTISREDLLNRIMSRHGGVRLVAGWTDASTSASQVKGSAAARYAESQRSKSPVIADNFNTSNEAPAAPKLDAPVVGDRAKSAQPQDLTAPAQRQALDITVAPKPPADTISPAQSEANRRFQTKFGQFLAKRYLGEADKPESLVAAPVQPKPQATLPGTVGDTARPLAAAPANADVSTEARRQPPASDQSDNDPYKNIVHIQAKMADGTAYGSGIVVSKSTVDGQDVAQIVTNNHVVGNDKSVTVNFKGKSCAAQVVKLDRAHDLALVQVGGVCASVLHPVALADSDAPVQRGDKTAGVGFPGLSLALKASVGRVLGSGKNFIATSGRLFHGQSGGALVNAEGQVIGVNRAVFEDRRTGRFAGISQFIPVSRVHELLGDTERVASR